MGKANSGLSGIYQIRKEFITVGGLVMRMTGQAVMKLSLSELALLGHEVVEGA